MRIQSAVQFKLLRTSAKTAEDFLALSSWCDAEARRYKLREAEDGRTDLVRSYRATGPSLLNFIE